MNDDNKFGYTYPTEELDKIIDQMNRGITPMMSDQLAIEVKLRLKELQDELFDEDGEYIDSDLIERQKALKRKVEEKKREATKQDVKIIKLTDAQKQQLLDDMSESIVRPNPNDIYNLSDDELYSSTERKVIEHKLMNLKSNYFNPVDYRNAIKIIHEAIMYSLENDYPWMSKEEAIREFNAGKIKSHIRIPKLYLNARTEITDKEVLHGIVTGEVTLIESKPDEQSIKTKRQKSNPVSIDYNIMSSEDFKQMSILHRQGYDTPASPAIKLRSNIYNRFAMPLSERFSVNPKNETNNGSFDWTQPNAGEKYYDMMHNTSYTLNNLLRDLNADNNGELNNMLNLNAAAFLRNMKYVETAGGEEEYNHEQKQKLNQNALRIEQNILNAIRSSNMGK